jgi:hypothetical protein
MLYLAISMPDLVLKFYYRGTRLQNSNKKNHLMISLAGFTNLVYPVCCHLIDEQGRESV